MKPDLASETPLIPPALLEQVQELAAAERRPASDVMRDAIERYLLDRRRTDSPLAPAAPQPDLQEVVDRILELRKGNILPEGVTIRDLMTYGRA